MRLRATTQHFREVEELLNGSSELTIPAGHSEFRAVMKPQVMRIVGNSYRPRLPWYLWLGVIIAAVVAFIPLFFFFTALFGCKPIIELKEFAPQGDFFGGHIGAIIGSITLLVVLLTAYMQIVYERGFRLREHFLSGIAVIGQYDIDSPGCEQALRLVDYYSAIALELKENELLLLLNTVMTREVRKKLEELDNGKQDTYLDAREARKAIQHLLETYHRNRKRNDEQHDVQS